MKKKKTITKSDNKRKPTGKKAVEESLSFFDFIRKGNPRLFAHHPDHPAFEDHVWTYHGLYFCKGCTMTFAGILLGGIFYRLTGWLQWFSEIQIGLLFLVLLLPSVATSLIPIPRIFKHITRFLLGILVAAAIIMLFITDSWAVRLVIVGTFLAVRTPLERKRRRDNEILISRFSLKAAKKAKPEKVL
ncbi:MAG: hypothetical protein HY787_18040 [Deltaproteobacteria bacterium]|nr:hypothetical protein [Deltaproteobacteria bacterium]